MPRSNPIYNPTPTKVFEKLMDRAVFNRCLAACPDDMAMERWLRQKDGPMPEKLKPGYLLTLLNDEEREALKGLTSDVAVKYRLPYVT